MSIAVSPLPREDLEHVFEYTRLLWEELRGERIFITGGTGFFGFWLVESLLTANERLGLRIEITILTRNPEAYAAKAPHITRHPAVRLHCGDVRDFSFPSGRFGYVVHAATGASAKLNAEAPLEMVSVIVDGTRRVLEFAAHAGVRKLLLTSSGAVYGRQPSEMTHMSEDYMGAPDPLDPASAYGQGKRFAEHLCMLHGRRVGFEVKIARCFAFVGPHLPLDAHFAVGNFVRDALAGGPIRIGGDGTPTRSYLYAGDLTVWLWTMLCRGAGEQVVNVGSNESLCIRKVAERVRDVLAPTAKIEVAKAPVLGAPVSRYVPDITRAAERLALRPIVPLNEALCRWADWLGRSGKN